MLELIVLIFLYKTCAETARSKGYTEKLYGVIPCGLMIGCELLGLLVGTICLRKAAYFFGLGGAEAGAFIGWLLIRNMKEKKEPDEAARG